MTKSDKYSILAVIIAGAVALTAFFIKKQLPPPPTGGGQTPTPLSKRQQLANWANNLNDSEEKKQRIFGIISYQMQDSEISDLWDFIFNYDSKGITPPTDLLGRIYALHDKYNLFS